MQFPYQLVGIVYWLESCVPVSGHPRTKHYGMNDTVLCCLINNSCPNKDINKTEVESVQLGIASSLASNSLSL